MQFLKFLVHVKLKIRFLFLGEKKGIKNYYQKLIWNFFLNDVQENHFVLKIIKLFFLVLDKRESQLHVIETLAFFNSVTNWRKRQK